MPDSSSNQQLDQLNQHYQRHYKNVRRHPLSPWHKEQLRKGREMYARFMGFKTKKAKR